jgi:oligopeptide/dipeptide ABC transporter ATP-binding protein
LRLLDVTSGSIAFDGANITDLRGNRLRELRRDIQVVFQDPLGSLNPRMRIGDILAEPMGSFGLVNRKNAGQRVGELLSSVGLDPGRASAYPRQLSGGQRQRVGIARALALDPRFIVLDEAVSALDVSVQAQIVNLLVRLRQERGLAYLFIAHSLAVVRHISHRVAVMYLGRIVEVADSDTIFAGPGHPYTEALLSAVPVPEPGVARERIVLRGEPPSPTEVPAGCRFRTRCRYAQDICAEAEPPLQQRAPRQWIACHFPLTDSRLPEQTGMTA